MIQPGERGKEVRWHIRRLRHVFSGAVYECHENWPRVSFADFAWTIEADNAPGSTHTRRKYVLKTQSSSSLLGKSAQTFQEGDALLQTQARYGTYRPLQQSRRMTRSWGTRAAMNPCGRMPLHQKSTMRVRKDRVAHNLRGRCQTSSLDRTHFTDHQQQFSRRR